MIMFGAWLYRWRGAAHPKKHWFPRPFNQIAFAVPYALVTWLFLANTAIGPLLALVPTVFVLVLTTLAVLTGHGGGMDLGTYPYERKDERLEFIVKRLRGRIPEYWYDALLLSITGLAITLPSGIITLNPTLALSGILKGPAYMLARQVKMGTAGGELLTGAVLWGTIF